MDSSNANAFQDVHPGEADVLEGIFAPPDDGGEAIAVRTTNRLVVVGGVQAAHTAWAKGEAAHIRVVDPAASTAKEALAHATAWPSPVKARLAEMLIAGFGCETYEGWSRNSILNVLGLDDRTYRRLLKVIGSGRQDLILALEAGSTTPTEAEIMAKGNSSKGSFSKAAKDVSTAIDVPLEEIDIEEETQSRAAIDPDVIMGYSEVYKSTPDSMPPVSLVRLKSGRHVPGDGHCRISAARMAGLLLIKAIVAAGTLEDARWFSAGSNKCHGLPRSNADKRRAVVFALKAKPGCSDRQIGEHVGVDHKTVAAARANSTGEFPQLAYRLGQDGKRRKAIASMAPDKALVERKGGSISSDNLSTIAKQQPETAVFMLTPNSQPAKSPSISEDALTIVLKLLPAIAAHVPEAERQPFMSSIEQRIRPEISSILGW